MAGATSRSDRVLRVTAQLIDTEDGFHVWSETYDRATTASTPASCSATDRQTTYWMETSWAGWRWQEASRADQTVEDEGTGNRVELP